MHKGTSNGGALMGGATSAVAAIGTTLGMFGTFLTGASSVGAKYADLQNKQPGSDSTGFSFANASGLY
jgi:hypothetical protein